MSNTIELFRPAVEELETVVKQYADLQSTDDKPEGGIRVGMVNMVTDGDQIATSYVGNGPTIIALFASFLHDCVRASDYDETFKVFVNDCLEEAYKGKEDGSCALFDVVK